MGFVVTIFSIICAVIAWLRSRDRAGGPPSWRRRVRAMGWGLLLLPIAWIALWLFGVNPATVGLLLLSCAILIMAPGIAADLAAVLLILLGLVRAGRRGRGVQAGAGGRGGPPTRCRSARPRRRPPRRAALRQGRPAPLKADLRRPQGGDLQRAGQRHRRAAPWPKASSSPRPVQRHPPCRARPRAPTVRRLHPPKITPAPDLCPHVLVRDPARPVVRRPGQHRPAGLCADPAGGIPVPRLRPVARPAHPGHALPAGQPADQPGAAAVRDQDRRGRHRRRRAAPDRA